MAEVKVPALLHKMSKAAQKAWYKKKGMEMPADPAGRSAAAAKKIKVEPRKTIAVKPDSIRAINAAKQQAYMAKGGRQPIGAMGSGGASVTAGSNMSTAKGIVASIKAGFNPKVSLDPYESERAKKTGPRSLKMKNEETQIDEVTKKEAEAALGGPVKDKPKGPAGKLPLGFRMARSAARKAMKGAVSAVHKSMEKTMQKEDVNEAVKDAADKGEYDYEGDMAKSQLRSIMANSKRMHDMLEENTNLPEWVQSKITLAEDYISTASNYMQGEMNEEVESVDEKYMGFAAVKKAVAAKGARNPAAVAAYIGRKKYGKEKFQAMAAAGKKANEEVVTEAEGKVAVTPKEKDLAAHHGDKTRITYGDVIKARLKSVAAKKMGK